MMMRLSIAPWFPTAAAVLFTLIAIGYQITDDDFDRLIESALTIEVC